MQVKATMFLKTKDRANKSHHVVENNRSIFANAVANSDEGTPEIRVAKRRSAVSATGAIGKDFDRSQEVQNLRLNVGRKPCVGQRLQETSEQSEPLLITKDIPGSVMETIPILGLTDLGIDRLKDSGIVGLKG